MVYVEFRVCGMCGAKKSTTEFYKTIKKICMKCRDEQVQRKRNGLGEFVIEKQNQDINELREIVDEQAEIISDMKGKLKTNREKTKDLRKGLRELREEVYQLKATIFVKRMIQ